MYGITIYPYTSKVTLDSLLIPQNFYDNASLRFSYSGQLTRQIWARFETFAGLFNGTNQRKKLNVVWFQFNI